MLVTTLPIHGAILVTPQAFADERGYFKEVYSDLRYRDAGIAEPFVQDNVSVSQQYVLRGLHGDNRMAKLVQVLSGRAFDVIVDIRRNSPTYRQWYGVDLSADNHTQVYIPAGCLHGFLALESDTILLYKQSARYDKTSEIGLAWDDPDIDINWPLAGAHPRLSLKDASNPTLAQFEQL